MTKQTKTKPFPKRSSGAEAVSERRRDQIDPRMKLLCQVAGNVAGALVRSPSPAISTAEQIAAVAVDIAEEILKRVGVDAQAAVTAAAS